jgi:hypothetical protein
VGIRAFLIEQASTKSSYRTVKLRATQSLVQMEPLIQLAPSLPRTTSCHFLCRSRELQTSPYNATMRSNELILALTSYLTLAFARDCYYPNGGLTTGGDQPCGSSGIDSFCCPFNWQCLSNGLCYDPAQKFYGRYTCTDRTWNTDNCAWSICTNSTQASTSICA